MSGGSAGVSGEGMTGSTQQKQTVPPFTFSAQLHTDGAFGCKMQEFAQKSQSASCQKIIH